MPQKYAIKEVVSNSYYHIYAVGAGQQPLFRDIQDYRYFLGLLDRYLSGANFSSPTGVAYPSYANNIELAVYALERQAIHLLLYQHEAGSLAAFMRSIMTSYARYMNRKYQRTGAVFSGRYKARRLTSAFYVPHVSRYIHTRPRHWQTSTRTSLDFYIDKAPPCWLKIQHVTVNFGSPLDYVNYLEDVKDYQETRSELLQQRADV